MRSNISLRLKFVLFVVFFVIACTPIIFYSTYERIVLVEKYHLQYRNNLAFSIIDESKFFLDFDVTDNLKAHVDVLLAREDVIEVVLFGMNRTFFVRGEKPVSRSHKAWLWAVILPALQSRERTVTSSYLSGQLKISFNDQKRYQEIQRVYGSAIAMMVLLALMAALCLVLALRVFVRPITQMTKTLNGIQSGIFAELTITRDDDYGRMARYINEIGRKLKTSEQSFTYMREQTDSVLDRVNTDHIVLLRSGVSILPTLDRESSRMRAIARGGVDCASQIANGGDSALAYSLVTFFFEMMCALSAITIAVENEALDIHQCYTPSPLVDFCTAIKKTIAAVSEGQKFNIALFISPEIIHSSDYALMDINAHIRLLVAAFQHWPKVLQTGDQNWRVDVNVNDDKLGITLTVAPSDWEEAQWENIHTLISGSDGGKSSENSIMEKMLIRILKINNIDQSISFSQDEYLLIEYSTDLIRAQSEEGVATEFESRIRKSRKLLLVGGDSYLQDLNKLFSESYVHLQCLKYGEAGGFSDKDLSGIGTVLVDCSTDTIAAKSGLKQLLASNVSSPIRIAVVSRDLRERYFTLKRSIQGDFDVDAVMTLPFSRADVTRVVNGLSSGDVVSNAIQSLQEVNR
ncbi:MAG: hypothetical protein COA42_17865 [Alteromonadaceae bacterium]|nr:MAG: hypothetical protein COA42_17865 [Alteromonadaceae bacterium]